MQPVSVDTKTTAGITYALGPGCLPAAVMLIHLNEHITVKHLLEWMSCHPGKPRRLLPGLIPAGGATAAVKAATGRGGA